MKLLALHLTNVRKFTGKKASITGIGDGITVVSEANEFGKSTFFDATHALFFEKYSSSAKAVKSLQPYAGGAVEIAADVENNQGSFRVEKRFISKKAAKITRLSDGATIAQDDEAERWISTLLGKSSDGPAGLLWVRQGQLGLEADNAKEKSALMETRRDLMSSVAGEIDTMTGGRRMDRVMREVAEKLAEITTKTGRKSGLWKAASDEADQIETELNRILGQVQILETALAARNQAEILAKRLDNPDAKARREGAFVTAQAEMEKARAHIGAVRAAQQDYDLAALQVQSAQNELDALLRAIDTLDAAQSKKAGAYSLAQEAQTEADRLKVILADTKANHLKAVHDVSTGRKKLDVLRIQLAARKAKTEATELTTQITKAEDALRARDLAQSIVKASHATPQWLNQVEDAFAKVTNLQAVTDAQSTTINLEYVGDTRVTRADVALKAGETITLDGDTRLDLPGIGTLMIHAKTTNDQDRIHLANAKLVLKNTLAIARATTFKDARTLIAKNADAQGKVKLAQAILDTLAPNGIDVLRSAKADTDLAANGINDDDLPTVSKLEEELDDATAIEAAEQQGLRAIEMEYAAAREEAVALKTTTLAAQQSLEDAIANAGPVETRDTRRSEQLRDLAIGKDALAKAETHLTATRAAAPDINTTTAELKRAQDAVTAARQERIQLGEQLAALSSEIRTLAGNGIEERRDELTGELETVRTTEARFQSQAAALTRLQTALNTERDAARDTYFGPVQEELKPLLSILHKNAALNFDSESLLPTGLMRDNSEETMDDLSGGTKEQIAILTRLAFARLFARQGRHMPIILDDALVYSDDDRIIKMFTALTRVGQEQQIIVFSCRQLAFQDLGGARPKVEVSEA